MTESQSPSNSSPVTERNLPPMPPMPPPPPTFSTQRQMTQTLDMSMDKSTNTPVAGHRPVSPPPIPSSVPLKLAVRDPL